jgi:hypothetical protein
VRTWKRRWFILKAEKLYYFKTKKVCSPFTRLMMTQDTEATGCIELSVESFVRKEKKNKQAHAFAVGTQKRVFFMYPDNASDTDHWIKALSNQIDILKGNKKPATVTVTTPTVVVSPTVMVATPTPQPTPVGK